MKTISKQRESYEDLFQPAKSEEMGVYSSSIGMFEDGNEEDQTNIGEYKLNENKEGEIYEEIS